MKRNGLSMALRALLVESVGALLLLLLLLPAPNSTALNSSTASRTNAGQILQADSTATSPRTQSRFLPLLQLPPPPSEVTPVDDRLRMPQEQGTDRNRQAFVEREFEYARRAWTMLVKQHVECLVR
jgi:hypothetical protein